MLAHILTTPPVDLRVQKAAGTAVMVVWVGGVGWLIGWLAGSALEWLAKGKKAD